MGTFSASTSTAIDNRQAITDQGLGVSSSGTGNNTALQGHIFNIGSTSGANSNTQPAIYSRPVGGFWGGGIYQAQAPSPAKQEQPSYNAGTNISILDNGAINKAFDFAAFSLSETLGSIINSNKQTASQLANAQQYSMETIGQAINSAATTTSQAQQQAATQNSETLKKYAMIGAVGLAAWYFLFKGK